MSRVVSAWISHVSHHLGSLIDVIGLSNSCAFVYIVECFDASIRNTPLGKDYYLFAKSKTTKQLAVLIISSTPSLGNIAQISSHSFLVLFSLCSIYLPSG